MIRVELRNKSVCEIKKVAANKCMWSCPDDWRLEEDLNRTQRILWDDLDFSVSPSFENECVGEAIRRYGEGATDWIDGTGKILKDTNPKYPDSGELDPRVLY